MKGDNQYKKHTTTRTDTLYRVIDCIIQHRAVYGHEKSHYIMDFQYQAMQDAIRELGLSQRLDELRKG
jgi:hypothetical protein